MRFFSPTSDLKELLLLQHIEDNSETSQHIIAKVINAAASMVNFYINRLEKKGYLKRDYQSAKIVHYNITHEGIKRKNYLAFSYLRELIDVYRLAKENVLKSVESIVAKGYRNVLLYGAGEVAETIIEVVRDNKDSGLNIVAIVDDDKAKIGTEMLGYKVVSINNISGINHDAIIITSYTYEEDISKKLMEAGYPRDRAVRFFGR
ncbi:MAG: winged helix-turn-helix transcriptional regulator [Epulopiscium sp.]|nr:winged helix-turn-helix transcriptional regulator [Candidatus Epulonipiscium sp.]